MSLHISWLRSVSLLALSFLGASFLCEPSGAEELECPEQKGAHSVEAIDLRNLKPDPRVFEEMFPDELNELSAAMAAPAQDDEITRFEPPPPATSFRRVWRSKGSLRSSGAGLDQSYGYNRSALANNDLAVPYIGDASSATSSAIRVGFDDQIIGFDALTRASPPSDPRLENADLSALQTAALIHAKERSGAPSAEPKEDGKETERSAQCPMGHQWRVAVLRFGTNYYYDEQFYQTITGLIAHKLIDTSQLSIEQGPHVRTTERGRNYVLEGLESDGTLAPSAGLAANYDVVAFNRIAREGARSERAAERAAESAERNAGRTAERNATPLPAQRASNFDPHWGARQNAEVAPSAKPSRGPQPDEMLQPQMISYDAYRLWHGADDHTHRSDYYMPLFKNFTEPSGYAYYVELTQDSCFSLQADGYYSSEWDIELHRKQIQTIYERAQRGELDMVLVFGLYDISLFAQMGFNIPVIVVGHDQDILYNSMGQSLADAQSLSMPSIIPPVPAERRASASPVTALDVEYGANSLVVRAPDGTLTQAVTTDEDGEAPGSYFVPPDHAAPNYGLNAQDDSPAEILAEIGGQAEATLGIVTDNAFSLGEFSPYRNIFVHLDPIMHFDDLVNFYHMMRFKKLGVIMDTGKTFRQLHSLDEIRSTLASFDVQIQVCTGELITKDRAKARSEFERCSTELIDQGVDAVYVTRNSATTINKLYSQLWPFTSKGIAVFARGSTAEVKAGALMGYSYGYSESFRHYQAQVISSVMNGRSLNTISQYFYPRRILTVNAKIASLIGWYPSYNDLSKIDITYLDVASQ